MKYYTDEEIANPPSLLDGYTIEMERLNRRFASAFLDELSKRLTLFVYFNFANSC
jgi:hypothetical protein